MALTKAEHKFSQLQRSALSRNKEFKLTLNNIKKLIQAKKCAYTGIEFSNNRDSPLYKTIDRVDPDLGYIAGNVVACTAYANGVKERTLERVSIFEVTKKDLKTLEAILSSMSDNNFKTKLLNCTDSTDKIDITLNLVKFADRYKRMTNTNPNVRFEMENIDIKLNVETTEPVLSENPDAEQVKHNIQQPSDVEIARAYVGFAEKYPSMNLTFSAFSGKLTKKTCEFSKDKIENVFLFVLDSSRPVTYHNVIAIEAKYKPVLEAIQKTGVSINNFGTMLKNLSSNYQID